MSCAESGFQWFMLGVGSVLVVVAWSIAIREGRKGQNTKIR